MNKISRKTILLVSLLLALIITGCQDDKEEVNLEMEEDYLPVEIEEVQLKDLDSSRNFSASILAGEEAMVVPMMMGQVQSVKVQLGDRIEAGSQLFTINQDEMKSNLEKARLGVDMARQAVEHSEEALNMTLGNQEKIKKEIQLGEDEISGLEELVENEMLEFEKLAEAEAGLKAGRSQLKGIEAQIGQAEMALSQAQGQLKQAELNYSQLKDSMDKTIVRAPISGIVSNLDLKKGQLVSNSQPAAIIVDIDRLKIEFFVTEDTLGQLKLGQELELDLEALDRKGMKSKIEYISPMPDPSNGLYLVKSSMDNSDQAIKPGMSLKVSLKTEELKDRIALPANAVLGSGEERYVFIANGDRALKRRVQIGGEFADLLEIKSGLLPGDKIIVRGQEYADDGRRIKIVGGDGR